MTVNERLQKEIKSFQNLWEGGYCEGNPLDPVGHSGYGRLGYMSVLHATYITCIKPYIFPQTNVLEIGPGRGCWTKCFINANEIWCLDALSAEYNNFWNYIGKKDNVKYIKVDDFSCSMLPEDHFDYFFTFGCFCHISNGGIDEYMKNVYPKLKHGAHGFVMIGDYEKYNNLVENRTSCDICNSIFKGSRKGKLIWKLIKPFVPLKIKKMKDTDDKIQPGRWYAYSTEDFCRMLVSLGYVVIDKDCGVNHRDPVIHFIKR